MITKETMQQIAEEEKYRNEIRKTLETTHTPTPKSTGKLLEFLNSTFFLAVLSSFLIPFIISYYNSNTQERSEREAFTEKFISERKELKYRINVISRIDTSAIDGDDYREIMGALQGYDSASGASVREEFARKNINHLLADYEFDLKKSMEENANESNAILTKISTALPIAFALIRKASPYVYVYDGVNVSSKKADTRDPFQVDFWLPSEEQSIPYLQQVVPVLNKFQ